VRSSLHLLALLAVALIFQAGFCPAICLARSADSIAEPLQDAHASRQPSCHMGSHAPAHAANPASSDWVAQIPSREATPDSCGMDCSRVRGVAAASQATSVDSTAPPAIVSSLDSGWLSRSQLGSTGPRGSTSEPPPRNLLLVKNSFLI